MLRLGRAAEGKVASASAFTTGGGVASSSSSTQRSTSAKGKEVVRRWSLDDGDDKEGLRGGIRRRE